MAKLLKLRRGTTSQHGSFTGAEGEVTVDTDKETLVVHDGSTAGGHAVAAEDMANVSSADIVGRLGSGSVVNAKLDNTGVTAASYTNANITINNQGRITSAASGSSEGTGVLSTGESTAGKFLRTDGDGTSSWTTDAGNLTNITPANISSGSLPNGVVATAAALTGTATGVNLTLSGDLTVNGNTTTVATTNTTLTDNLIELNSGASSNANDAGILIERGSTGDNAIIAWDESADKFTVGTTTATASSTGDITITTGTLVANVEGDLNGTAGVATTITTALEASDTSCNVVFTTAATGDLAPKTSTGLTYNSATGALTATSFSGDGSGLSNLPATSPAGSNNTIQFNNNGSFGSNGSVYIQGGNGIYAMGGFTDSIGNVRYVGSQYIYTNSWVNSTSQVGRCLLAQGNFYLGSIASGAIVSVVNDTGSDITISRQTS